MHSKKYIFISNTVVTISEGVTTILKYAFASDFKSVCYPNTEKLRQFCIDELGLDNKLSIATISRDLEYLRNSMEAPIEYDRYNNGYFYSKEYELKL